MWSLFCSYWSVFRNQVIRFLKQGLSPRSLAISITIGMLLGLLPLLGIGTPLLGVIAWGFRLNLPIMLSVSYLVLPLQLILILPFIKTGEWMFGVEHSLLSLAEFQAAFDASFFNALAQLSTEIGYGVLAWGVICIPLSFLFFAIINYSLQRWTIK